MSVDGGARAVALVHRVRRKQGKISPLAGFGTVRQPEVRASQDHGDCERAWHFIGSSGLHRVILYVLNPGQSKFQSLRSGDDCCRVSRRLRRETTKCAAAGKSGIGTYTERHVNEHVEGGALGRGRDCHRGLEGLTDCHSVNQKQIVVTTVAAMFGGSRQARVCRGLRRRRSGWSKEGFWYRG